MKKIAFSFFVFFISASSALCGYFFANKFEEEITSSYSKGINMASDYFHKIEKNLGVDIKKELKDLFA